MRQEELEKFSKLLDTLTGKIEYGTIRLLSLTNVKEEVMRMEEDTFRLNFGKPIFIEEERKLKDSCNINLSKDIFSQLQEYQQFFKETANIYFTPNIFKYGGRESQENVRYITTLFADIDHVSAEEGLSRLKNSQLPEPSYVIFSGHGVHLYWILSYKLSAQEGYIKSWLKVQNFISSQLNSDSAVNEISRFLRIPTSTNNKKNQPIETRILIENLNRQYDFREDFYNKFCKSKEKFDPNKYKNTSTEGKKKTSNNKQNSQNNYAIFLRQDIEKILKDRKASDYEWEGLRNNTLYTLKCLRYSSQYLGYVNNEIFDKPLSSTEFNHITNSKQDYPYMKRKKVFKNLKITDEEEEELKVLINESEAICKKRIKELEKKYERLLGESIQYTRTNYVNTANKTIKEVAKIMKVSEREVSRIKKKEYSIELKNSIIKTQLKDISLSLEIVESLIDGDISIENKVKIDELGKKILWIKELMSKDNELTLKNKFKITILLNQFNQLQQLKIKESH